MIVLKALSANNEQLQATFDPAHGMRLTSFRKGGLEVIAGESGPIGPHFESLHPEVNSQSFFDGIARYAPWKVEASEHRVRAQLVGKEEWNGKSLAALEGQGFTMELVAVLSAQGLAIDISVVADADALAGYGFHFKLPKAGGTVVTSVQDHYLHHKGAKLIPADWGYDAQRKLNFNLDNPIQAVFHPAHPLAASIRLDAMTYQLEMRYQCQNAENAWQLKRNPATSNVYLAALGAKSPYRPVLTVNSVHIELSISQ